ncbi:MAG: ribonuclease HII, partial [Candidatus Omnitrophota bacterium]
RRGYRSIAGVDEAGRGPLAGPVVAAAVLLGKRIFSERIDDSKRLSPKSREKAFFEIVRSALVSVGIVDNRVIDRINILSATRRAMESAVFGLGLCPDIVLIDGPISLEIPFRQESIIRGDSRSLSIAAASIVAKVVRDRIMVDYDRRFPRYAFARHKGYGTRLHFSRIRDYGLCSLHRISFIPSRIFAERTCEVPR